MGIIYYLSSKKKLEATLKYTMRTLVMFMLIILYHPQNVLSNSVPNCITLKSYVSGEGDDDIAAQKCENTNYPTLVSCGFETKDAGDDQFQGSYIKTSTLTADTCIATNANNGAGVFAHARCCRFEQTVTCAASDGNVANRDDQLSTKQCNSVQTMLGCSGFTIYEYFDGTFVGQHNPETAIAGSGTGPSNPYPMSHHCNAQNGRHEKTQANINCCTTTGLGLDCNIYYAPPGKNNELACPAGKTMMSCNAQSNWMSANAWYIENGVCKTRSTHSDKDVYTSAICCSETTLAPTPAPTNDPTKTPTDVPSTSPTTEPTTAVPTSITAVPTSPTTEPTAQPTQVTGSPTTAQPTSDTGSPSVAPSITPTVVTDTPSTSPIPNTDTPSTSPTTAQPTTVTVTPTTAQPTIAPSSEKSEKKEKDKAKDNGTLYLILFIVFGILFCCALLGVAYYCFKNRKQDNEVNYNNAHVAVAHGSPENKAATVDDDDIILDGINKINMEGAHATTTDGGATTGGTIVDASVGIKTTSGATMKTTDGGVTTQGGTKGATQGATTLSPPGAGATTTGNAINIDEDDDEKSDVFKVSM